MVNKVQENSTGSIVLRYVTSHPGSLTADVVAGTGLAKRAVEKRLSELKVKGYLTSERVPGKIACRWTAIDQEAPRQLLTKEWTSKQTGMWIDFAIAGRVVA